MILLKSSNKNNYIVKQLNFSYIFSTVLGDTCDGETLAFWRCSEVISIKQSQNPLGDRVILGYC